MLTVPRAVARNGGCGRYCAVVVRLVMHRLAFRPKIHCFPIDRAQARKVERRLLLRKSPQATHVIFATKASQERPSGRRTRLCARDSECRTATAALTDVLLTGRVCRHFLELKPVQDGVGRKVRGFVSMSKRPAGTEDCAVVGHSEGAQILRDDSQVTD